MMKSPDLHGEIKAKLTALAQLIQLLEQHEGLRSAADLARRTGYSERAIRKAKAELGCRANGTRVPEPECQSGTIVPQTEPGCRNQSAERHPGAFARVIDNNKLTSLEETPVSKKHPLPPRKPKSAASKPNAPTPLEALTAFEAWNQTALRCGLPQAAKLTPDRQRKILARLREYGLDGWRAALANIEKSSFLTGSNDRNFRADLDFLVQAKSFGKVHDGGYGNGRHAKSEIKISMTPHESEEAVAARRERMLAELGVI